MSTFRSNLYKNFRPFADAAGLECLDSGCDLVSKGRTIDMDTLPLVGTESDDLVPLVGFRTTRAVDRICVNLLSMKGGSAATPAPFYLAIRIGCSGSSITDEWSKVVTAPSWDASGRIVQLSGVLFDTVQFWGGSVKNGDENVTQQAVIRCFLDRCGGTVQSAAGGGKNTINSIDGPFT